ncbi:hypothetical protein WMY93_022318 [Mugilogobius chulae]|uniref:Uncharacterized protein n=1 Tax=Mugilogobius chulae TaxID=88201 RepID=A0AAW0NDP3_9GOBI
MSQLTREVLRQRSAPVHAAKPGLQLPSVPGPVRPRPQCARSPAKQYEPPSARHDGPVPAHASLSAGARAPAAVPAACVRPVSARTRAVSVGGVQPCYSLLPSNQHTTMSSTVSFLPAPMMEQLPFSQNSSPCVSQTLPGQQYTGLLPHTPGSSMVMLQMTSPPSCQQPRAPSPCHRKPPGHHKHNSGSEHQRPRRTGPELQLPLDNTQSSLPSSPALTPSPGQSHGGSSSSIKALPTGLSPLSPLPIMAHPGHPHPVLPTAFCHPGQGEAHYSLVGQTLQYKPSIRPPLLHTAHVVTKHQGPLGMWRSSHGRRANRKPVSSDLS